MTEGGFQRTSQQLVLFGGWADSTGRRNTADHGGGSGAISGMDGEQAGAGIGAVAGAAAGVAS